MFSCVFQANWQSRCSKCVLRAAVSYGFSGTEAEEEEVVKGKTSETKNEKLRGMESEERKSRGAAEQ